MKQLKSHVINSPFENQVVRILLERGANIDASTNLGVTPLQVLCPTTLVEDNKGTYSESLRRPPEEDAPRL